MFLLSAIPTPYRILALIGILLAAYGLGRLHQYNHMAGAVEQANNALLVRQLEGQKVIVKQVDRVVTKYINRVAQIATAGAHIKEEIPLHVTPTADHACVLPDGFVRVHDAAVRNEPAGPAGPSDGATSGIALSTVAAVVADNYTRFHQVAEQVKCLQAYVRVIHGAGKEAKDFLETCGAPTLVTANDNKNSGLYTGVR